VLFTSIDVGGPNTASIEVFSFRDSRRKALVRSGTFGRYLPSGHLVYINQGTLYALRFDLDSLEPRGTAVAVLENVEFSPTFGFAQFDFSRTGAVVYRRTAARGQFTIQWLSGSGKTDPIVDKPGPYFWPRLSPDSERLAVCRTESGGTGIWIADLRRGTLTPQGSGKGNQCAPVWSPDGRYIIFQDDTNIVWEPADVIREAADT
jgi:hypothetical protein